jgi:signal transduction histidine kinase/CheY-like chemotaxis protein
VQQPQASVLVIDDEEVIRTFLVEALSAEGFEVSAAESGEEALKIVRRRRFDLAITDLKMPGMDGIQTLRALKDADRDLQVVIMTGYASLDTAVGALKGGAFDYILKPFLPSEISMLLRRALDRSMLEGLMTTYGASRVLIASMAHSDLCRMAVDLAMGFFLADRAELVLRSRDGAESEIHGAGTGVVPSAELLERLVAEGSRLGGPFSLPTEDPEVEAVLGPHEGFGAALVYPLIEDGRTLGAICLLRSESARLFTSGDLQRGTLFASEVARALTGARMKRDVDAAKTEIERLRGLLQEAHRASMQGKLAAAMSRELSPPIGRIGIGVRLLESTLGELSEALSLQLSSGRGREERTLPARDRKEHRDLGQLLERTPQSLKEIRESVARLGRVMEIVHRLGEPEGAPASSVDLNAVVDAAVETLRGEAGRFAVIEVERAELPPVACHPGGVGAAILAILGNALDAVRSMVGDSGERGRIAVRTAVSGSAITVTVSDDGCGVPSRMQGRIFDPWFSTRSGGANAGLGLEMARRVIESEHGGELTWESRPGEGSAFTISLPAAARSGQPA